MRRTPSLIAVSALALALSLAGCASPSASMPADSAMSAGAASSMPDAMMTPSPMTSASAMPAAAALSGSFAGEGGKTVSGTVTITGDTVTLTGFATDEGPDLHFYLANGTDEQAISTGVRVAAVSTDAAQTFTLPDGVSAADYTDLVVHCDKAKAVFGAASLTR